MERISDKSYEPPMFLQRPSLGSSQDISHVLARAFRDLTRQSVGEQTVKNLTISRSGEERYHEEYVERLAKIQSERQQQLDELAMLETHIMQARAAATAAEEQELQRASEECSNYESLGLPPVKSYLRSMMDVALLKQFNLITPDDYVSTQYQATHPPQETGVPSYARPTTSSLLHTSKDRIPDNYIDESLEAMTFPFTAESPQFTEEKSLFGVSKSAKSRVTSSWRDSIKPDQRHRERTNLQRLNAKVEYLRNPRNIPPNTYPTLIKTDKNKSKKMTKKEQLTASASCIKSSDVLIPSPSPVVFRVYEVGEVYEIKLELKNVSSSSRQIRVLPPATKFFSIGLGQYPGEQGIIAPGMSCQFAVKFAPDSLTDYVDKIQIRTQLDDTLDITLLGKRKPPQLTIPAILDCGYCLVGGNKTVSFKCRNVGGPGRFCVLHEAEWPTTSWKWSLNNPGYLTLEPFCMQPAMFQLLEGEEIELKLTFQPLSAKYYKHEIFMVCDNCQVKQFTIQGVGQTARVEFMSIDGGVSQAVIGESCDPSANYLVRFSDQNPCTTAKKKLVLKNMSNVPLPFKWKIMKPCMRETENDKNRQQFQAVDKHSVYSFSPSSGIFQPDASSEFEVTSSPIEIGDFHSVAHLVLEKVPVLNSTGNIPKEQDVTSMKVEFKMSSKPFQIMVDPPLLLIPGKRLVGKTYKFHIKIKNNSVSNTSYDWETSPVIDIQPKSGYLDINQQETLELNLCGIQAGDFASTVKCHVNYSTEPIYVHVKANFEGPFVRVENADIDFGLVRFSCSAVQTITITNLSEVSAVWCLKEALPYNLIDIDKGYKEMPSEFQFTPENGELGPFQKVDVRVVFTPLTCRRVRSVLECDVLGSPPSYIRATAEVQNPEICILSSNVILEEVYVDVPVMKEVILENKTLLFSNISWKQCLGEDSQFCSVQFQPSSCTIGPRERQIFTVSFTGSKEGPLNDIVAVCEAEGMEKPIYLSFSGTVRGLEVMFRTETVHTKHLIDIPKEGDENQLSLNYGKTNLGDTPKALVILTNKTAISTKFNVAVEYFCAARTPTPPTEGSAKRNIRGHGILARSPNIADPLSKTPTKTQADFCRSLLRDGRGAAFVCRPSCGELLPFQERILEVTAYTDMWGEYSDHLICKVDGIQDKRIPIFLNVQGCPLNFQMSKEISPVVRFGSHVSGAPPVERVLRVNNTSPCDIRLDWEVYNINEDDEQLIDLIIDIGDPHPKIIQGKEVVPARQDSGVPLITVDVRQHIGRLENVPFSIKQAQQIVPARKHSDLKVVFNPYSSMTCDVLCSSFSLGFISLDNIEKLVSSHVKRCTGRNKEPFRLNMTACIKPAILSISADDEGTQFKTSAGDLLKISNGAIFETMKEVHKISHYTLSNTSQATVSFRLFVEKPFNVLDISAPPSACSKDGGKITTSKIIVLKPRKNVQIAVGFCLSHDMLSEETHDVTELKENGVLPIRKIEKNLQILFSNQTSQTLPLTATISLPHLLLSKERIDFGVSLVGHKKEMNVKLTNFGKSDSCWFVEKDARYPAESREVFGVEPACGFLEGHISNISKNDVLLKLTFVARNCIDYECMLVFKGLLHEPARYLLVTARGSYDGGHEDLVTTATI